VKFGGKFKIFEGQVGDIRKKEGIRGNTRVKI